MKNPSKNRIAVLVVEDNPGDMTLTRRMLASSMLPSQFEVIHASSLSAALVQLRYGADIVLLDLNLPDSQGLDTLYSIRTEAPSMPIIILTSADDHQSAADAIRQGAQDYLIKGTIDAHLLAKAILRHAKPRS